jgi:hypothetical protein
VHILIIIIEIGRTPERVGARLGDGVDAAAYEIGLAHIVRGYHDLHLVDGFEGDGIASTGKHGIETEVIVEVGTVETEIGGTTVTAGEAHAVGIR